MNECSCKERFNYIFPFSCVYSISILATNEFRYSGGGKFFYFLYIYM